MAKDINKQSRTDQAAHWVARLRSDEVTEQDEQGFALWLAESADNKTAFDEILLLWETMGSAPVSAVDTRASDSPSSQTNIHALPFRQSPANASGAVNDEWAPHTGLWSSTGLFSAIAASVLVIAVVVITRNNPAPIVNPATLATYDTNIGEQNSWTLDDGSTLELNTATEVQVRYLKDKRELTLVKGEAWFDVASDNQRPFVVTAGDGQITAVGTAFNINIDDQLTRVTVTEGIVQVQALGSAAGTSTEEQKHSAEHIQLANQGQQIDIAGNRIFNLQFGDTDTATAWRRKTLIFNDQELSVALTELNRYLINPVDVSDPSLEGLRISGTFSLEDPETTLDAIIATFQLQTANFGGGNKRRLIR